MTTTLAVSRSTDDAAIGSSDSIKIRNASSTADSLPFAADSRIRRYSRAAEPSLLRERSSS